MNVSDIEKLSRQIQLDMDDGGDDDSSDVDESELMNELQELCSSGEEEEEGAPQTHEPQQLASLLTARIHMYRDAVASTTGPKKRRYERAITTLNSQLKLANSGQPIDEAEIPPEIKITTSAATQPPTTVSQLPSTVSQPPTTSPARPEVNKVQPQSVAAPSAGG